MTEETLNLLKDGTVIMALGMGFVFFFLTLMVGCIALTGAILKLLPEEVKEEPTQKRNNKKNDEAIAVAIAAAKLASYKK